MVNLDILGGLKSALERGDSLEKAMRALFNASYKREEIEEAAKDLADFRPDKQIEPIMRTLPKIAGILPSSQVSTIPSKAKSIQELKSALEREHSLKKAMLILFNSGYKLEEIIKAARDLLEFGSSSSVPTTSIRFISPTKIKSSQEMQIPTVSPKEVQIPTIIRIPGQMQKQEQKQEQKTALAPQQSQIPTIIRIPGQIPMPPQMLQQQQQQAQIIKSTVEIQRPLAQKPVQKVSNYEKPKKERPKGRTIIIILICMLIFLVSLEGVIFIFKQQFINFLNSLLG